MAEALKGKAWERPAQIWYDAMLRLSPASEFAEMSRASTSVAEELGGAALKEVVADAWDQAGVSARTLVAMAGANSLSARRAVPNMESAAFPGSDSVLLDDLVSQVEARVLESLEHRALAALDARLNDRLDVMARQIDRLLEQRCVQGATAEDDSGKPDSPAPQKKRARKKPSRKTKSNG